MLLVFFLHSLLIVLLFLLLSLLFYSSPQAITTQKQDTRSVSRFNSVVLLIFSIKAVEFMRKVNLYQNDHHSINGWEITTKKTDWIAVGRQVTGCTNILWRWWISKLIFNRSIRFRFIWMKKDGAKVRARETEARDKAMIDSIFYQ